MGLNKEQMLSLYETMVKIRDFEVTSMDLMLEGKLTGFLHSYAGEEAIAAGVCSELTPTDCVCSTHRGHGHIIAKGGNVDKMMAELYGKATGYCKGKSGSMHIADISLGIIGANGIVAAGLPIANGVAFAMRYKKMDGVVVAFFGDGATNRGTFHEALNLASVWNLPVIFVCENNGFGMSNPQRKYMKLKKISDRAAAYGIAGVTVDGNDPVAVKEAARDAVKRIRDGQGPTLLECITWRHYGHYIGDPAVYKDPEEQKKWLSDEKDPIARFETRLVSEGIAARDELDTIKRSVHNQIENAIAFAEASPDPAIESLYEDVYCEESEDISVGNDKPLTKIMTMVEAIRDAQRLEMLRDPSVFLAGEDVAVMGSPFGQTGGLLEEFGPERVLDMPISEAQIISLGVGSSSMGLKAIVPIDFMDFMGCCMDEVMNQAAKLPYMMGGQITLPMVIRTNIGGGIGGAAQHSQSMEALFTHIPGLKVVAGSNPADAKGLLESAIRDNNPVIVLEHKTLNGMKGEVPVGEYLIPIGKADIKREGTDVTLISYSGMVNKCLEAAETLAGDGISAEVLDLRTLIPLDEECIIRSIDKTGRVVIAYEATEIGGYGGEIAAMIADKCFDMLDAPVKRVAAPYVPVPFSAVLEREYQPNAEKIIAAVKSLF